MCVVLRPRDGKQLTIPILIHALQEGYGLSTPFVETLVRGSIFVLGQAGPFSLKDLARHNRIEHNASLVHDDTTGRDEYAPTIPNLSLVKQLLHQAKDGHILTAEDVARARVDRESVCPVLNLLHAEFARGEMAMVLGIFGQGSGDHRGVPLDFLREWLTEERLPDGWKPTHTQGLLQTVRSTLEIGSLMATFKREEQEEVASRVRSHGVQTRNPSGIMTLTNCTRSLARIAFNALCILFLLVGLFYRAILGYIQVHNPM